MNHYLDPNHRVIGIYHPEQVNCVRALFSKQTLPGRDDITRHVTNGTLLT